MTVTKRSITDEFKEKGLYNPDTIGIISTNKNTAGIEFSITKALEELSSDGDEIEITVKKSSKSESTEPLEEE